MKKLLVASLMLMMSVQSMAISMGADGNPNGSFENYIPKLPCNEIKTEDLLQIWVNYNSVGQTFLTEDRKNKMGYENADQRCQILVDSLVSGGYDDIKTLENVYRNCEANKQALARKISDSASKVEIYNELSRFINFKSFESTFMKSSPLQSCKDGQEKIQTIRKELSLRRIAY